MCDDDTSEETEMYSVGWEGRRKFGNFCTTSILFFGCWQFMIEHAFTIMDFKLRRAGEIEWKD